MKACDFKGEMKVFLVMLTQHFQSKTLKGKHAFSAHGLSDSVRWTFVTGVLLCSSLSADLLFVNRVERTQLGNPGA